MMAEFYKVVFDLSVYYTVSGYYLALFTEKTPSGWGILLLCITAGLCCYRSNAEKSQGAMDIAMLMIPGFAVVAQPGLWPVLHLLPAWFYVGYLFAKKRYFTDRESFRQEFLFALRLLLVIPPSFLFGGGAKAAFVCIVPYLTLMLASGVCLLRMLREHTRSGVRQMGYVAAFLAVCLILAVGHVPQALSGGLYFLYHNAIVFLMQAIVIAFGVLLLGVLQCFSWILALLKGEPGNAQINMEALSPFLESEEAYSPFAEGNPVAVWVGSVILAAVVLWVIVVVFRRLLGNSAKRDREPIYEERKKVLEPRGKKRRLPYIRPRDPRLAVRFYYAKFMQECLRRGIRVLPGQTSEEVVHTAAAQFPMEEVRKLTRLYGPARYSTTSITSQEADEAAELWHRLKHSKLNL